MEVEEHSNTSESIRDRYRIGQVGVAESCLVMREIEGVRDTRSWVTGPRVGADGGVIAMATVGVEATQAVARTRSRRPSGRQRH
jgi:hypothetical protein